MPNGSKVAIVTGASRGIGAAVATRLAADGFAVIVNFAGKRAPAQQVADQIEKSGGKARVVQADVSKPTDVARLFDEAEGAFGGIDVLVANAGIMQLAPIVDTTDELFDKQVAVNLKGVFNCVREAGRRILEGGRIISFSSSVVGLYQPTYGSYAATKAAIEALNRLHGAEGGGSWAEADPKRAGGSAPSNPMKGAGPHGPSAPRASTNKRAARPQTRGAKFRGQTRRPGPPWRSRPCRYSAATA